MQLGNGRWESTQFNSRLQPTQIAVGTTQNATDLLKLNYSYGTTDNNGNVRSQKITVPGITHPFMQTYSYDALNRLESAVETQNLSQREIGVRSAILRYYRSRDPRFEYHAPRPRIPLDRSHYVPSKK